jgi:hypothetical protein
MARSGKAPAPFATIFYRATHKALPNPAHKVLVPVVVFAPQRLACVRVRPPTAGARSTQATRPPRAEISGPFPRCDSGPGDQQFNMDLFAAHVSPLKQPAGGGTGLLRSSGCLQFDPPGTELP